MTLLPLPFALPESFLRRLGYRRDRRIVAVYWEPAGDEAAYPDGVHSLVGANHDVYWELTRHPEVRAWLWQHAINLGNSDESATPWLLVDRATGQAYIGDAPEARERVKVQLLADWAG